MWSRGLPLISKLMGVKLRLTDIYKKTFTLCKVFENVPFFEHIHSKFAKSTNKKRKEKFKISYWSIKKCRILC
jgi:hypothetical protein